MEKKEYREYEYELKTLDTRPNAAEMTKTVKAHIRFSADTRLVDMENFRRAFNAACKATLKAWENGTFYSGAFTVFAPYVDDSGEYVTHDFHEWRVSMSYIDESGFMLDGFGTKDDIWIDRKNPFKSLMENF